MFVLNWGAAQRPMTCLLGPGSQQTSASRHSTRSRRGPQWVASWLRGLNARQLARALWPAFHWIPQGSAAGPTGRTNWSSGCWMVAIAECWQTWGSETSFATFTCKPRC